MEQEKRTFKNPKHIATFGIDVFAVTSADGDGFTRHSADFSASAKDWDVEITFTKKLKPIPDGTLAKYESGLYAAYYIKRDGVWYYLSELEGSSDVNRRSQYQDDEWFRLRAKPLTTSEWE